MDAPAQSDRAGAGADERAPVAGLLEELSLAVGSARAALSNLLDLVSLEARRAGLALMWMVAWGFIAAICFAGAWIGLMAALAMWAVSHGFAPITAALSVAAISFIAAGAMVYACVGMSRALLFSATRRQVAGRYPVTPPAP